MSASIEQLLRQAFDHFQAGRLPQAEHAYRKVLDRSPYHHEALHMLAVVAHKSNQPAKAEPLFARAIQLAPDLAHYHSNAGQFYAEQGRHAEAVTYYARAATLDPAQPTFRANLAESLRLLGRLDDAETAARAALAAAPDHAPALATLGNVLRDQGRVPEAIDALRRSLAAQPTPAAHDSLLFALHYDPDLDPRQVYEEHLAFGRLAARFFPAAAAWDNDRSPDRPLRVGYVSPDFRAHPIMDFVEGLLREHNRSRFDVFCYAGVLRPDDVTRRVRALPVTWRDVLHATTPQLAAQVRADRIDVLVDLAGHTAHNRLLAFALRPAPVQVTYLGNPGTTGLATIDYRLTDAVADPPGGPSETLTTEALVRLPSGLSCFAPAADAPDVSPLPARSRGHVTFGSLHTLAKVNDRVLDLWARVLHAVPGSRLLLLRNTLAGSAGDRYRQALVARGVAADRLDVRHHLPAGGHLAAYREFDVALDVFPFAGHTTACEGLSMGVPIVTLPGPTHASRLVASVLTQAGLPELIASSPDDYVAIAARLAADLPALGALRSTLRQRILASPLCDARSFARDVESAYRDMWRTYCQSAR